MFSSPCTEMITTESYTAQLKNTHLPPPPPPPCWSTQQIYNSASEAGEVYTSHTSEGIGEAAQRSAHRVHNGKTSATSKLMTCIWYELIFISD